MYNIYTFDDMLTMYIIKKEVRAIVILVQTHFELKHLKYFRNTVLYQEKDEQCYSEVDSFQKTKFLQYLQIKIYNHVELNMEQNMFCE